MKKSLRLFLLIGSCLFLGCATTIKIPVNRFDTPEAVGKKGRVKLGAEMGGANEVVLTSDYTLSAPDPANPGFDTGTFFRVRGGAGLMDKWDVEIRNFNEVWTKFQLLGDPQLRAQQGNFSVAITGGIGIGKETQDGSAIVLASQRAHVVKNEIWGDAALILGYRLGSAFLVYSGPFIRTTRFSGTYEVTPSSTGITTSTSYSGNVFTSGANVGIECGSEVFVARVEAAYANEKMENLNTGRLFVGIGLSLNIGENRNSEIDNAAPEVSK